MPNSYPLQSEFNSGEISPRLKGKTTSAEYQTGLSYSENFEVTPQGSIEMRSGTEYISTISDEDVCLQTFKRVVGDDVVVIIGQDKIRLANRDGPIFTAGGQLVTDPTFQNGINDWSNVGASRTLTTPIGGIGVVQRCWYTEPDLLLVPFNTVYQDINLVTPNVPHLFKCKAKILDKDGGTDPPQTGSAVYGVVALRIAEPNTPRPNTIIEFDEVKFGGVNGGPAAVIGEEIDLEIMYTPTSVETVVLALYINALPQANPSPSFSFNVQFSEISVTIPSVQPVEFTANTPTGWKGNFDEIQVCQDTALGRMFFTCPDTPIKELNYTASIDNWTFSNFDSGGKFTGDGNYPKTCTLHQGRLWLGGSPNKPSTLWASETWNYNSFTIPTTATPASPLEFTLTSNGAIKWIDGLKYLLVGTDRGEVIGRSSGPVITNSDFDFPVEQSWGSSGVQPIEVGNRLMYCTSDLARVRSLYDGGDNANGYESADVTIQAGHLMLPLIRRLTFQRSPDYHLNMLMRNGSIITSTFYPAGKVNAFTRNTTNGEYLSMTSTEGSSGTGLWCAVRRVDGAGDQKVRIEYKAPENSSNRYLDSYIVKSFSDDGLITGLSHLDAYDCGIVLLEDDGNLTVLPNQTPVSGNIQLPFYVNTAGKALVGIPYTAKLETLQLEAGTNREGTAQVQKRRFNEVFLRLFESGIPKINGKRPAIRTPDTQMNRSQKLYTGDTTLNVTGWNDGVIKIEQDLPLPVNLTAIFGKSKGSSV